MFIAELTTLLHRLDLNVDAAGLLLTVRVNSHWNIRRVHVRVDGEQVHLSSDTQPGRTLKADARRVAVAVCDMLMQQD